ncbi:UDP-N-acetylmuramoyl-L-alanyl-D-glutamate--2,6-diaminopimelate ligase [Entomospira entomophila]|uniref:UDP-N-acetylmuramyl-tripeptide synthetase n=1 Tax=Entomospira entomophila TaxID=2719988 RepID=A0A968G9R6_9SPIO|nr:UDP-N-acetylmuramoyl-L-alanyl-D-glutamate--2,6-diaminopimelate ligase [Entomospira entomophilus]NIZ41142.1 UDP-N-acetylmuramoyl-L-alanyl-D-glutamate--2,6-diaminopimelate ligase [Entomospira entomophilus]WDI35349.1 UDP-N-acetylmuramoyl-L-alanyl-D-glutamate--2,6-diaminopimelate ligase [Entomospira entomophilus]
MILERDVESITQEEVHSWGIQKIIFDSRDAKPNVLFCALTGLHVDGHEFIEEAKEKGARHFLISKRDFVNYDEQETVYIVCDDTRKMMAKISALHYDFPSRKLKVIGVTGTDGKSTTSQLVMQLLELSGHRCGLLSTVNIKVGEHIEENNLRQSTPEAPQIEEALYTMLQNGMEYAVVEATSHGLSELTGRLSYIQFIAGVFTNVTIEHLEFHKTVEQYRLDKANLFKNVAVNEGISVINANSEHYSLYHDAAHGSGRILSYGKSDKSDLWAESIQFTDNGFQFDLSSKKERCAVELPLTGQFNIDNTLAAVLTVSALLDCSPCDLASYIPSLRAPAGRMILIQQRPYRVIVDYAHTPGAFEQLLPHMKEITTGKLIVMFGSGGERNLEKRPIQGHIADLHADIIILTNEDPRLEDEMVILKDIAAGVKQKELDRDLLIIPDRESAIRHAVSLCDSGDTLLLLGKGHEQSIIGSDGKMDWDEVTCVNKYLAGSDVKIHE